MLQHRLEDFSKTYKNSSVTIDKLEQICPGSISWQKFVEAVLSLEKQGILKKVSSTARIAKNLRWPININQKRRSYNTP